MRLTYWNGQTDLGDTRPLVATRELKSASLNVDLDRTFTISGTRSVEKSPLEGLLGIVNNDSSTRRLELVVWGAGLDWAWAELGQKPPRAGTKLTGHEVVGVVDEALTKLKVPLALLARAAALFADEADLGQVLHQLGRLEQHANNVTREIDLFSPGDGERAVVVDTPVSDDLIGLAVVELTLRFRAEETGAVCANCNSLFFHAERTDEIYCRRAAPGEPVGGRTCRQIGPQKRYAGKIDELTVTYRRRYKRLDQQARRGDFDRAALDKWRTQARNLLDLAQKSRWSADEFDRALDEYDPKRSV